MHWGEVPCEDRNGEITSYIVEYSSANTYIPHTGAVIVSGADNRTVVVGGLLPSTTYTMSVRVQGAPVSMSISSNLATIQPTGIHYSCLSSFMMIFLAEVGFFLAGNLLPFNSIVLLSDIGEGGEALVCFTDSTECCIRRGAWLQPSGAYVRIGIHSVASHSRADRIILLNRMNFVPGLTGIFTCLVPSAGDSTALPYYVGIYEGADEGESYSQWQLHFFPSF